ncbi:amidohydrolase [Sediminispirochaeta smaragdinae]|jgi:aminobenzoyl-glutamate utilization protein A|uniref:Amidohydrolase n=1 Tax=Sediminispirochaeta smaragdinae (strain DSM 11293 / JCM 15392 / SEBR 4228) TaxID=573413 RepID=E1RCE1_SEDSS|nr:amidohydrolase [Sediminispirochaeta smaragdinae]ADK80021.1 amidohydrolase [Sediminispirochaeta smaragdinae DSM 11293]
MASETQQVETDISALFFEAVEWRRSLHRHPQSGWLEFYATGFVAKKLESWGYQVLLGDKIIDPHSRLFLPAPETMDEAYGNALSAGIDEQYIRPAKGGLTGVVGIIQGKQPGPVIAYRFDIDSLEITETSNPELAANKEGFVSCYRGYAHMCGHDANTATGLLLAKYLSQRVDSLCGTVKLIFQPDEERLSGAKSMVAAGVVDDVDYLMAGHIAATMAETGAVAFHVSNMLSVSRSEITFHGASAHSTGRPDLGKNAILGACSAALNLHTIARHGNGLSVVHVGKITGGDSWNNVADRASLWIEVRAASSDIDAYLQRRVQRVLEGAAESYDLHVESRLVVSSEAGHNSPELIELGKRAIDGLSCVTAVPTAQVNASEDFVAMANIVRRRGGQAMYMLHGSPVGGGLHSDSLEIDEKVIRNAAVTYAAIYEALTKFTI